MYYTAKERNEIREANINRLREQGYTLGRNEEAGVIVLHRKIDDSEKYLAAFYFGNSTKSKVWRFRNLQHLTDYLTTQVETRLRRKAERKQRRKNEQQGDARDHYTVGDVVYTMWGYEQTNVDFYQVTRVSKASVWLRPLSAKNSDQGGPCGGYTQPDRNNFTGEEMRKKFNATMPDRLSFDYCGGSQKWTGKALHTTSYH